MNERSRDGWCDGWRRLITYTLDDESGASLRAAGWRIVGSVNGHRSWSSKSRPRVDRYPRQNKIRWEATLSDLAGVAGRGSVSLDDMEDAIRDGATKEDE